MRPQNQPRLQRQTGKTTEQYLAELEALLKKNTGTGLFQATDATSNTPMYIPGQVRNASGLGDTASRVASLPQQTPASSYQSPITQTQVQSPYRGNSGQQPQEIRNISDFFGALDKVTQAPERQVYDQPKFTDSQGIASTADGGVLYQDGSTRYPDGSIKKSTGEYITPIASMAGGLTKYSDGSSYQMSTGSTGIASIPGNRVLYDDKSVRYGDYQYDQGTGNSEGSITGLISGIFGQNRPITQQYGNYNPQIEPGSGYNTGTDIRTRDLPQDQRQFKLPVNAKVLDVKLDDGTRWGTQSGHQGWGNSVLVELPTGEKLRFSHLGSILNIQPGDTIQAGQVFGTPGQTGNVTGEHLDLEYFAPGQDRPSDPSQFSGFVNPQQLIPGQPEPGSIASTSDLPQWYQNQSQPQNSSMSQQAQPVQSPMQQTVNSVGSNVIQPVREALGSGINKAGTALNAPGLGLGELASGDAQGARNEQATTIANTGNALGLPELGVSEAVQNRGLTGGLRQLAGDVVDTVSTPFKKAGLPDFGISEAIANNATVNTDKNLAPQGYAYDSQGNPIASKAPDYGSTLSNDLKNIGTNVKDIAVAKAGEGVDKLKEVFSPLTNIFKSDKVQSPIGPRAVGNESANPVNASFMESAPSLLDKKPNDNRDQFFKQGGAELYADSLKKGVDSNYKGALTLDLFNDSFFGDLGNVSNVFSGTHLQTPAVQRYVQKEQAKYPKMSTMDYQDGYDRGAIDDYNKQINEYNSSLDRYFNSIPSALSGQSNAFVAPAQPTNRSTTPIGSSLSRPSSPSLSNSSFSSSALSQIPTASFTAPSKIQTPSRVQSPQANFSRPAPNSSSARGPVYVAPRPVSVSSKAPPNASSARGPVYNPPRPSPVSSSAPKNFSTPAPNASSAQGPVYNPPRKSTPAPKKNIFQRTASAVSNIFRRWF